MPFVTSSELVKAIKTCVDIFLHLPEGARVVDIHDQVLRALGNWLSMHLSAILLILDALKDFQLNRFPRAVKNKNVSVITIKTLQALKIQV